ncbi:unnamed protein product, partial [Choristocarpus tenellus]
FTEEGLLPTIVSASAGSDLIGCHTAVIDTEGLLYTWGVGVATGQGGSEPVLRPRWVRGWVDLGEIGSCELRDSYGKSPSIASTASMGVRSVACGGGFTLALTTTGQAFSWGSWTRGRLGLGFPPERTTGGKKRIARFQSVPKRLLCGLDSLPILQVEAGSWHGIALTCDGAIYSWGHNGSGQLGYLVPPESVSTGKTRNSTANKTLHDSWVPVKVEGFGSGVGRAPLAGGPVEKEDSRVRAVHIACGAEHSFAIDSTGGVWAWGGEGQASLGLGQPSCSVVGTAGEIYGPGGTRNNAHTQRIGLASGSGEETNLRFMSLSQERGVAQARAVRAKAQGWAVPRRLSVLDGAGVVKVAAGKSHTAFLTKEGRMFLCGEGAVVMGGDPTALEAACRAELSDTGTDGLSGEGTGSEAGIGHLVEAGGLLPKKEDGDMDPIVMLSALSGPTAIPREACASWLPALATRCVTAIACGGQHIIVLAAGDHIGSTLGRNLFSAVQEEALQPFGEENLLSWGARSAAGVDCVLLVAGSYLYAHKIILARRSPVLRDMISEEDRLDDTEDAQLLQLLLPDLRYDVAKGLLEFIYTGDVTLFLDLASPITHDLKMAAAAYGVKRLEDICQEKLTLGHPEFRRHGSWETSTTLSPTLAADLGGALGTSEHADVKFVAGGRPIYAHRVVLACQSQYFAAMFRCEFGMCEGDSASSNGCKGTVEVVVPGSHKGLLRLLLFIYSGLR